MGKHSTAEPRRRSSASVRIPPARPRILPPEATATIQQYKTVGVRRPKVPFLVLADKLCSFVASRSFFSGTFSCARLSTPIVLEDQFLFCTVVEKRGRV